MNSPKQRPSPPSNRPRLIVILPLALICAAVVWFIAQDRGIPPQTATSPVATEAVIPNAPEIAAPQVPERPKVARAGLSRTADASGLAAGDPPKVSEHVERPRPALAPVLKELHTGPAAAPAGLVTAPSGVVTILGRALLRGTPPPEVQLPLDPTCGVARNVKPTTRFFAVDSAGGLGDVVVLLSEGVNPGHWPAAEPALLDQNGCEYVPYVLGLRTGQKLLVRNSDPVLHNVHPTPLVAGNRESNRAQIARGPDLEFAFDQPEHFLRFKCDVHQWMFAYVTVVSHPFFAVSRADGTFAIRDIPPGEYTIEAHHRKAGKLSQRIVVNEGPRAPLEFVFDVPSLQ